MGVIMHHPHSSPCLRVDLRAIQQNYRLLQEKLGPAHCGAVVKANAYGVGAIPVSQALYKVGCREFFVATPEEAFELRETMPHADAAIAVFSGIFPGQEADMARLNITPVLNTLWQIELWKQYAESCEKTLPAILHVDSGINRLGLDMSDIETLAGKPELLEGFNLRYVISHLACAPDPVDPHNALQKKRFDSMRAMLPKTKYSLANAYAVFLNEEYHYDLARVGVAFYGTNPTIGDNPMQQVLSLSAPILQVHTIQKGEAVGYDKTFIADKETRIATIALGYADGMPWKLSGHGVAYVDYHPAPFAGRVSMDYITLDVTDVPESLLSIGKEVEFIGRHSPLDVVAQKANTIPYVILTRLGKRFRRHYDHG